MFFSPKLIVTYFSVFTFVGVLISLPFLKEYGDHSETIKWPANKTEWSYAILISICGLLGEFFLTAAFQLEKANYIAVIRCGDTVSSIFIN